MSRCLVTGAAGFIGSHLCEALLARGHSVRGIDSFTDYYEPARKRTNLEGALAAGLDLLPLDLTVNPLDTAVEHVDTVYHLAGQPGVRGSWSKGFDAYVRRNIVATQRLLEAAVHAGGPRFVFASSSSVYGNVGAVAARESDRPAPVSPYGMTKAACEELVGVYQRTHGLSAVSLRYFTVYGPRQRPEMAFASFIRAVLSGSSVQVLGDGTQSRDFTYVDDVVAATIAAAESGVQPLYNISGGANATVLEAIAHIENATGRRARVRHSGSVRGDAYRTAADLTVTKRDLRYDPAVTLREGLERQAQAAIGEAAEHTRAAA